MNSLTALAHASALSAPAFNADFYTTAVTVIPVLFLAINVQTIFQDLGGRPRTADLMGGIVNSCMIAGIGGEILAIIALNSRIASPVIQDLVVVIMIELTAAVGVLPILAVNSEIQRRRAKPGKTDPA